MKLSTYTDLDLTISYSQNREDIILASFLSGVDKGFYIDVGAAHPEYLSVSKYFYERGWSGINIEPNPRLYNLLLQSRPRDRTLRYAISSDIPTTARFREYLGDGLSTLSTKMVIEYKSSGGIGTTYYKDYEVPVISLAKLLIGEMPEVIHFMKVDVEGFEYKVLESNDWSKFRPRILCIESNHIECDWYELMEKNGYKKAFNDGLNEYFADMKFYDTIPKVNYGALYNPHIVTPVVSDYIKSLKSKVDSQNEQLDDIIEKQRHLPSANGEGLRFRVLGNIFVKKIDAVIIGKLNPIIENAGIDPSSIDASDVASYDKKIWNMSLNVNKIHRHPIVRRAVFRGYRGFRKTIKKIIKIGTSK